MLPVQRQSALVPRSFSMINVSVSANPREVNTSKSPLKLDANCLFLHLIDCNAIFYGCTECSVRDDSLSTIQCDSCDFGLYLLNVEATSLNINIDAITAESYT